MASDSGEGNAMSGLFLVSLTWCVVVFASGKGKWVGVGY